MMKESREERLLDFRKILAIIQKNLIVMTRDRIRLVPLIMFPVLMIMVFGFISGNVPKHIPTAIVSYDNSQMSEDIQQAIFNSDIFSIKHQMSTEGEAKKLLDNGDIKVIIEIPPNLKNDIDNGVQTAITVIVDESDSSISAAAKQTLNQIVNQLSYQISLQKIQSFQQSVESSALILQNFNQINNYGIIYSQLKPAENSLLASEKILGDYAISVKSTITPTAITIITPNNLNNTFLSSNNIFVTDPSAAARAQLFILEQSLSLVDTATQKVIAAEQATVAANKKISLSNEYQSILKSTITPMLAIKVFTKSKAENILRPLVYEEKPAYGTGKRPIDFVIPAIIALTIFQGSVMGMGRSIAGEKKEGSLTRVFLTPSSNTTIIVGTLSFYILFELFRSSFLILVSILLFGIKIEGSLLLIFLILLIYTAVSTSLGLALSSIVKTEQQFMAMAMLVSMPSMFLSGAFFPIQAMPQFMQAIAKFLPVTYAGDALRGVMIKGFSIGPIMFSLFILLVFLTLLIAAVFLLFKRDIE